MMMMMMMMMIIIIVIIIVPRAYTPNFAALVVQLLYDVDTEDLEVANFKIDSARYWHW